MLFFVSYICTLMYCYFSYVLYVLYIYIYIYYICFVYEFAVSLFVFCILVGYYDP